MKSQKTLLFLSLCVVSGLFAARSVSAHQPQVVNEASSITVTQPEISKAYYAQLTGQPAHYRFTVDTEFALYVNVLIPDIPGVTEDYTVTINRDGNVVATLSPGTEPWKAFDEPFGHDVYRMGPEYRATGPAGQYDIVVTSPDNQGKYVLAIGEAESFPLSEIVRTMKELVGVKRYFGKSAWAAFESPFIYGPAIALALIVAAVIFIILRRKKKRAAA